MWASVEITNESSSIYLPKAFEDKISKYSYVSFGLKKIPAYVHFYNDSASQHLESDNNIILVSKDIFEYLHLMKILKYRLKISSNQISLGPVIGFLLGNLNHIYSPEHMTKYSDRLGIYDKIGGLVCAFSPTSIKWTSYDIYGLFFNPLSNEWQYAVFPIPDVIYRRDFHYSYEVINKLIQLTDNKLFNSYRFLKDEFNNLLLSDNILKNYIPPFIKFSNYSSFMLFLNKYKNVILKPTYLSRGRGICIIMNHNDRYNIFDYRSGSEAILNRLNSNEIKSFIMRNFFQFNNYIIQKYIDLASIDGNIFDIRIVVQKNFSKKWQITAGEARISTNGLLITNISRGGYPLEYKEAIIKAFGNNKSIDIIDEINFFIDQFIRLVDTQPHHIAELGIDLGIDNNGKLYFIEANVFPSFKGFKIIDYNSYLNIRYTPLLYSLALSGFKEEGEQIL